ncbi:MAG: hypothetical protein E3J92_03970 [Dehalococcoidia bacterium]|nr:MAG: hypothetical protein E3J92_03970 [Dehalococcoidia bacterium]
MDWTWGWAAVAAIATCVLAGSVFLAFWQIGQARRSINAQTALDVFRELRNPETVETLRLIYELTQDDLKNMPIETSKEIDHVIDKYAALEVWVNNGIIDKKIAMESGPPALRCWYRLHSYVESTRNKRGYYGDNFEALARLALDYCRKNKIQVLLWQEGHKGEDIDLIAELQDERIRPRSRKEIRNDRKKNPE